VLKIGAGARALRAMNKMAHSFVLRRGNVDPCQSSLCLILRKLAQRQIIAPTFDVSPRIAHVEERGQ
jgi:hypothetical protein